MLGFIIKNTDGIGLIFSNGLISPVVLVDGFDVSRMLTTTAMTTQTAMLHNAAAKSRTVCLCLLHSDFLD